MAQWNGQFSGLTHETKVQDIEASLRQAVAAFNSATEGERDSKSKAVRHLAERLLAARLKALRSRLCVLREPGKKRASDSRVKQLQAREQETEAQGVTGILNEFHFGEATVA